MSDSVPLYGFGGGGAALNFAVKQYASEAQLLAAKPKENTIGVVSDTKITGWYFVSDPPETMNDGDLWIEVSTGNSSKFNALKKNGLFVYPKRAKQFINGALTDVTAKIYQNGSWNKLLPEFVIFESGKGAVVPLKTYKESKASISVNTESIKVGYSASDASYVTSLRTEDKFNLAIYSTLYMECTPSKRLSSKYASFGVTSTAFASADPSTLVWVAKTAITTSSEMQVISVDLSAVNESLYIGFQFGGNMQAVKIWME